MKLLGKASRKMVLSEGKIVKSDYYALQYSQLRHRDLFYFRHDHHHIDTDKVFKVLDEKGISGLILVLPLKSFKHSIGANSRKDSNSFNL